MYFDPYTPEGYLTWGGSEPKWVAQCRWHLRLSHMDLMNPSGDCGGNPDWSIHSLHGVFAAVFFIAISKVCWSYPADMTKNKWLTWGSKACAVTMAVAITVAFLYYFLCYCSGLGGKEYFCGFSAVFWIEFFAVNAFAIYWALKSVDENVGLQRLEAVGRTYIEGLRLLPPWFQPLWDWARQRYQAGVKAERPTSSVLLRISNVASWPISFFAASQQFGRFRSEAEIQRRALRADAERLT